MSDNSFKISGTLIEKFPEVQKTEKFKVREFVIDNSDGTYKNEIKFQSSGDKTNLIEPFKVGDKIAVSFNIKGAKWKENWFVNLQAWKVELQSGTATPEKPEPHGPDKGAEPTDDLPF